MRNAWLPAVLLLALCQPACAGRRRPPPRVDVAFNCDGDGHTMLTCAAAQGRLNIAKGLLNGGAKVDQPDSIGATALHWAANNNHADVVQLLLNRRANINARNRGGGTPLHWAVKQGNTSIAALLLDHGARIDAVNNGDWTPIMMAANGGKPGAAKLLIDRGAALDLKNSSGQTAYDLAVAKNHKDIARMILMASRSRAPADAAAPKPAGRMPGPPPAQTIAKADVERMINEAVKKATADKPVPPRKSSDVDKPNYKTSENPDNYAVIIGIEKYSDIPDAEFAERDAAAVREHLVALGYPERNIVSLLGAKATKTGISKNIETWLPHNVNEKSTVFVYYSGHGAPDAKTGESYLVPWDGDPEFLADTAYPTKQLYAKLGSLKAKQVIVALDSCFSGAGGRSVLAKGVRPLVTKTAADAVPSKVISLSAAGGDQVSRALEEQGHGLFTYYLLHGLNGSAKDRSGQITVPSLYHYVHDRVADAARRGNGDQTPQLLPESSEKQPLRLR